MAGSLVTLHAATKSELKRRAQEWQQGAREAGMDIVEGYEPGRVIGAKGDYSIVLRAHS